MKFWIARSQLRALNREIWILGSESWALNLGLWITGTESSARWQAGCRANQILSEPLSPFNGEAFRSANATLINVCLSSSLNGKFSELYLETEWPEKGKVLSFCLFKRFTNRCWSLSSILITELCSLGCDHSVVFTEWSDWFRHWNLWVCKLPK